MAATRNQVAGGIAGALVLATALAGYFEGSRTAAYLDPGGVPTICSGSTAGVRLGDTRTPEQCRALLDREMQAALDAVDRRVTVPLTPRQRAAFADFVFNLGEGAFAHSTLLRKLNAGDVAGACDELLRWKFQGARPLPGLVARRQAERKLCLGEDWR